MDLNKTPRTILICTLHSESLAHFSSHALRFSEPSVTDPVKVILTLVPNGST